MSIELLRIAMVACVIVIIGIGYWWVRIRKYTNAITECAALLLAVVSILFIVFLWFNHINFPLNLEAMESTVLEHVGRLANGQYIYPAPNSDFIPLAYNPFFYVVALPFVKLLGYQLASVRLVAILGMYGVGVMLFLIVRDQTQSAKWGIIAVGLFAAAYRVMDTYLDNAHADGWFVFAALLGSYLISRNRSFRWNATGVIILVIGFWFKQHGAIFVVGGLAFLLWNDGWKPALVYAAIAAAFGAGGYLLLGPMIFGPYFYFFTWQVPRQWTVVNALTFFRYLHFILFSYPLLAFASALDTLWTVRSKYRQLSIWHFQSAAALLTGILGSLDPGSNNNVYIPMGVWFILLGTIGIYHVYRNFPVVQRHNLQTLLIIGSFALFLYTPTSVIVSPQAPESYAELISMLKGLNAQVYAPTIGQLATGYMLEPGVNWVALDDLVRGPRRDEQGNPLTHDILAKVIQPDKPAYILLPYTLDQDSMLRFLSQYYVLYKDLGNRFKSLSTLPKRFGNGWPEYLYRYDPVAAKLATAG